LGRLTYNISSFFWPSKDKPWYPFLNRLAETGRPLDELIGNILGVTVGASTNHAHATINVIDFYLDDARKKERAHIAQLIEKPDSESEALLFGYVCEAMRASFLI